MTTYAGLYGPEALIDGSGHPITSATIDVFTHGTTTHVSLYQDNARVTPLSNPVPNGVDGSTAGRGLDTYGNLSFYIDPGRYDLRIATGAGTRTVEIEIETDPAENAASSAATPFGWKDFVADYAADNTGAADCTAKLQQWITDHPAGGTLVVPDGTYKFSAAQTSGTANTVAYSAQVLFPERHFDVARSVWKIVGENSPALPQWGPAASGGLQPPTTSGPIFKSTATSGSFMSVIPGQVGDQSFSNGTVSLENLTVRLPNNPAASALAFTHLACFETDHVHVDVAATQDGTIAQPTTATAIGIDCPGLGNGALVHIKDTAVSGYYVALQHGEHAILDNYIAMTNVVGIQVNVQNSGQHNAFYPRVLLQENNTHIKCGSGGSGGFMIRGQVAFEDKTVGGWWTTTYDVDDSGNMLSGELWYSINGSLTQAAVLNGATGLLMRLISKATATSISPGIAARASFGNAGSGTVVGLGSDDLNGISFQMLGGAASRVSGLAQFTSGSGQLGAALSVANTGVEVESLITLSSTANRVTGGLVARAQDANNAIYLFFQILSGTNNLVLQTAAGGTYTTRATLMAGALVLGTQYHVRLRYIDGTITVWVDDSRKTIYNCTSGEATLYNNAGLTLSGIQVYAGPGNDDLGTKFDNLIIRAA